jgi:hypothetical protein
VIRGVNLDCIDDSANAKRLFIYNYDKAAADHNGSVRLNNGQVCFIAIVESFLFVIIFIYVGGGRAWKL